METQVLSEKEIAQKAGFLDSLSREEMKRLLAKVKNDTKILLWEVISKKS